jgi:AcrR family transcriptional regulator
MGIQERKEREREQRRQQIIVAAKRVFSSKGFNKATMEDIANDAELSPGTIYLYFKNKNELYASLSLRILQYLNIRLEHLIKEKLDDPGKSIRDLQDALYDVYEFDSQVLINMFHLQSSETLKNLSPPLLSEMKKLSGKALAMMAEIFKAGINRGVFIDQHPTALADIVWALFSGVVLWEDSKKKINDNKDYLKTTLDLAFEIFRRGITQ